MKPRLSISGAANLFGIVVALGFAALVATNFVAISQLKVGGPLYRQIVMGQDLIADILPPPTYIIEAKLEATLALNDPASVAVHRQRLAQLHKEYDDRRAYWEKQDLEPGLRAKLVKVSDVAVARFWDETEARFLPAIESGDMETARQAYALMSEAYAEHRSVIDQIVAEAKQMNAGIEIDANRRDLFFLAIAWSVAIAVFAIVSVGVWAIVAGVARPIVGLTKAMDALAAGSLDVEIPTTKRGDEIGSMTSALTFFRDSLAASRRTTRFLSALQEFTSEMLAKRELPDLLQLIIDRTSTVLDAPYCDLMLFEGSKLATSACTSGSDIKMGDLATREDARLAWQAVDCGQPVVIEDYMSWPNRRSTLKDFPLRCVVALPIMHEGKCLGVLAIGRLTIDNPFSGEELSECNLLASTLALVLTSAQQAEKLRTTASLLERAGNIAKVGGWELALPDMQLTWSDQTYRIHEIDPATAPILERAIEFFAPEARSIIRTAMQACIDRGEAWDVELPFVTAKGRRLWVRAQGQAEMRNGKAVRLFGSFQDITERRGLEEARRESDAFAVSVLNSLSGNIAVLDGQGTIVAVNEGWRRFAEENGAPVHVISGVGLNYLAVCKDADRSAFGEEATAVEAGVRAVLAGTLNDFELEYPCHSPTKLRWLRMVVTPLMTAQSGAVISHQDITRRRLAEQAALSSEARLSAILLTATVGIITVDEQHKIVAFNTEAEATLGYSAAEMLGQPLDRLIPTPNRDAHRRHMQDFAADAVNHKSMSNFRAVNGLRRDGALIPLMAGISKVKIGDEISMTVVFRDMSEIRAAELELKRLADEKEMELKKAEAANRAKSQFLATMSHELRTPLNAIIGFSSLIENETFGAIQNDKYKDYVADIRASGEHLLSLINDILDLSRIEASKYEFEIGPIDPIAAMSGVAALIEPLALQKAIRLIVPDETPGCEILGDRRAVQQILTNLVGNAVKFTDTGGEIHLRVQPRPNDGMVALIIADNGRGIPAEKIAELGQPFVQVSTAQTRDKGGSGLGLAICKSLAKGMNGAVEIESELGLGTTVRVLLPSAKIAGIRA